MNKQKRKKLAKEKKIPNKGERTNCRKKAIPKGVRGGCKR